MPVNFIAGGETAVLNVRFARRSRKRRPFTAALGVLLALLTAAGLLTRPAVCAARRHHIVSAAEQLIAQTVSDALTETDGAYFTLQSAGDGRARTLQLNAPLANRLQLMVERQLCQKLEQGISFWFSEPLGAYLGSEWFMTMGPHISIETLLLGNAKTALETDIESVGFNQTRYRLQLSVQLHLKTGLHFGADDLAVEGTYTVAEWMLSGEVPQMQLGTVKSVGP